jgi:hypothetical protein
MDMYGLIAYILFSEFISLLSSVAGSIAFVGGLAAALLCYGLLLCILVNRQKRKRPG